MKTELIHPDILTPQLAARLEELKNCLEIKKKSQRYAPEGHLRISQTPGVRLPQFFHITNPKDFNGNYIAHTKKAFISKLAQKDYDARLIKILQAQIKSLEKYIECSNRKIEQLYARMNKIRQSLITPVTLTNAQYIEEWKHITWQGLPFTEDSNEYYTSNKERVRSKSEVIIADLLAREGIPYRYEFPFEFNDVTFHPDFLCLNLRTRQEFIWEHFGMMDSPDYMERAIQKIRIYNENNYFIGKNLIITMETQFNHLNIHQLERLIETFLV